MPPAVAAKKPSNTLSKSNAKGGSKRDTAGVSKKGTFAVTKAGSKDATKPGSKVAKTAGNKADGKPVAHATKKSAPKGHTHDFRGVGLHFKGYRHDKKKQEQNRQYIKDQQARAAYERLEKRLQGTRDAVVDEVLAEVPEPARKERPSTTLARAPGQATEAAEPPEPASAAWPAAWTKSKALAEHVERVKRLVGMYRAHRLAKKQSRDIFQQHGQKRKYAKIVPKTK